jgi:hypothetical protein
MRNTEIEFYLLPMDIQRRIHVPSVAKVEVIDVSETILDEYFRLTMKSGSVLEFRYEIQPNDIHGNPCNPPNKHKEWCCKQVKVGHSPL